MVEEDGYVDPLPYVNIYVEGTRRGTFSGNDGFFSIVAAIGETVIFSSIGFQDVRFELSDTLSTDRYSVIQLMVRDTIMLPETVVYPWPSREHFKLEFLAMDVTSDFDERAAANLSDRALAQLIAFLPTDGDENVDFYLQQQAQAYYYEGQIRPMNIFNAVAWKDFIQSLKRGDFKKK